MTELTPGAKALRTFARLMAAPLAAAAAVNWLGGDAKLGAIKLTLAIITAALAGASAYLIALTWSADGPLSKAGLEFVQGFGAGLATVVVADALNADAFVSLGKAILAVAISAAFAAAIALVQISLEQRTEPIARA